MKQRFIIGLLLTLGSAITVNCCLADIYYGVSESSKTQSTIQEVHWKNGNLRYMGAMNSSGLPHGFGIFYNKDGTKVYEGNWVNGSRQGDGILYWDDGISERYNGFWIMDRPDGGGVYTTRDKSVILGSGVRFGIDKNTGEWVKGIFNIGDFYKFLKILPVSDRTQKNPWFLGGVPPNETYIKEKYSKLKQDNKCVAELTDKYLDHITEISAKERLKIIDMYGEHPLLFKDTAEI